MGSTKNKELKKKCDSAKKYRVNQEGGIKIAKKLNFLGIVYIFYFKGCVFYISLKHILIIRNFVRGKEITESKIEVKAFRLQLIIIEF